MIVCGQYFSAEIIARIQATIDSEPGLSRVSLSRRVCGWMNWRCPNGKWKEMSCRAALLKLHRRAVIRLRPASHAAPQRKSRELGEAANSPAPIHCSLRELDRVELLPVRSADSKTSRPLPHHGLRRARMSRTRIGPRRNLARPSLTIKDLSGVFC